MPKKRPLPPEKTTNLALVEGWQDRIKAAMEQQDMSMRRLSAKAGLGASTVRHAILNAEDIGLFTLAHLADALGTSVVYLAAGVSAAVNGVKGADDVKNVKVLPVLTAEDVVAGRDQPEQDFGYVAVSAREYPDDVQAMVVRTRAMEPEGMNQPPPQHTVVMHGDVILFAKSAKPIPGELVLAYGQSGTGLLLRRLAAGERPGEWLLVSHSHIYPRVPVQWDDLIGRVMAVHRKLPSRD